MQEKTIVDRLLEIQKEIDIIRLEIQSKKIELPIEGVYVKDPAIKELIHFNLDENVSYKAVYNPLLDVNYRTPELSEFTPGFEFEYLTPAGEWVKQVCKDNPSSLEINWKLLTENNLKDIRVKIK